MTEVMSKLTEIIKEIMETDDNISEDADLANEGMESIEVVELFVAIEKKFGVKIPESMYGKPKTIKLLADYIEKNKK